MAGVGERVPCPIGKGSKWHAVLILCGKGLKPGEVRGKGELAVADLQWRPDICCGKGRAVSPDERRAVNAVTYLACGKPAGQSRHRRSDDKFPPVHIEFTGQLKIWLFSAGQDAFRQQGEGCLGVVNPSLGNLHPGLRADPIRGPQRRSCFLPIARI
jgi:hypothetical protein